MRYTEEQTKFVIDTYLAAVNKENAITNLANELGKSKASIIAKLSIEKVYKAQPKTKRRKKSEILQEIADILEIDDIESLEKVTLATLEVLLSAIKRKVLGE